MNHTNMVQILQSKPNLETKFFHSFFCQIEPPLLNVVEEIFTSAIFKNDKVIVLVFEKINQANDVFVLAHFEHLNLSSLLIHLNRLHVFLLNRFYGCFDPCLNVDALSDQTKLPFSQNIAHFIEVEHVLIVEGLYEILKPNLANFFATKVENA